MANTINYSFAGDDVYIKCYFFNDEIQMIDGILSNVRYINLIIALIVNITLTITTISLNSVTILAYRRSGFLKSKKSYFLIMLLSVVDLLVGLFPNASYVLVLINIVIEHQKCEIYVLFYYECYLLAPMSLMTLFGLNIERYLSILHPFYHRTKVTKSKLLKMIVSFWFLTIILRVPSLVYGKTMNILPSILIFLIAFLTVYIYVAIFITARKRPRGTETREAGEQLTQARIHEERSNRKEQLQNIKMAKSCAIVVALVFTCNVPMALTKLLPQSNISSLLALWSGTVVLSASSMNSLVFFWKNVALRKEAKQLFKKQQRIWN